MTVLICGGQGFIGINFVSYFSEVWDNKVVVIDKVLPCREVSATQVKNGYDTINIQCDIGDSAAVLSILNKYRPDIIVNFAAETHVDTSIARPILFIENNVQKYSRFLETVCNYWQQLSGIKKTSFKMVNISTDEVYGSLDESSPPFAETDPLLPNNPYSASKAAADCVSRAFFRTYGLPIITTRCSNNYGPYQLPEKFIPLMIERAIGQAKMPIYGEGLQRRDWLFVEDHCSAIELVCKFGQLGETYNIGSGVDISNLDLVKKIAGILDKLRPKKCGASYENQIEFVEDRQGHDFCYKIDNSKIGRDLDWKANVKLETGLVATVKWYLNNESWLSKARKRLEVASMIGSE